MQIKLGVLKLACFVDIQQYFSRIFRIKDGNDFSQFGWTEALFYSLRRRKSIITGTTIPLYVFRQIARPHQNCTKCSFQDNLSGFNSLNRNVRMVACRQWEDSRVWEQITLPNRLLKLKYFSKSIIIKLLTGPPQKRKCFSEISR